MQEKAQEIFDNKIAKQKPHNAIQLDNSYKELPKDDFKEVDVVPGERQLREKNSFFRKMPEEGDLINTHNYLDLLFRLLYEDAV